MLLALVTGKVCTYAQTPHPAFRHYTVEDGLPGSEVYQVKQDSKGYIWFATGNGVSRFDGYEFTNFSLEDGLPDNTVFEIFEDSHGRVWFLPLSCRLSYYRDGKIHTYPYNHLINRFVTPVKCSFFVADNGSVFLGMANEGIFEITPQGKMLTHASLDGPHTAYRILEPRPSHLMFAAYGKEDRPHPEAYVNTRAIQGRFSLPLLPLPGSLLVFRMIRLHDGTLTFTYDRRLLQLSKNGVLRTVDFERRINWLYEDRDHDLWVGLYQQGVWYVPKGDFSKKKLYLPGNSVDGVLQDREGGFWFATEGNHVFYAPSKKILVYDKSSGMPEERVNCLASDGKGIYAGLNDGYLLYLPHDLEVKHWSLPEGFQERHVLALYYDSAGRRLSVSGRGRVSILRNGQFQTDNKTRSMFYRMVRTTDGRYWGNYSYGIYCYDDEATNFKLKRLHRVNGLLASPDNHIWLGTMDGLWYFDATTLRFDYWGNRHPLLAHRIMDIEYLSDSVLVMATKGAGILLYDFKNVVDITTRHGLCNNNVYELLVDGNTVWAGTNQGLNKITFNATGTSGYRVEGYTTRDGLPSNEIKYVAGSGGKIWVATHKGLAFFEPGAMGRTGGECPILINRIQVNDADTAVLPEYRLGYSQNSLKIGFTGLGYRNAGKLRYRYRMLGLDSNWAYTDNREIQFTTLPGGEYRFEVAVQNDDGSWGKSVATAGFFIVTPFWQRWWFQGAAILLLAALVVAFIRYRLKVTQKEKERDNELNRNLLTLKLKALRAQMNPHFTFNVMNSIQHFILNKDEESAHRYLSKFSRLIRTILNNSETDSVPLADEMKALALYLELEAMRFDHSFAYTIAVDAGIDAGHVMVPSMLMQPYVENAILHGILPLKAGGRIHVQVLRDANLLKCIIEDNGVGRANAAQNRRHKEHKSFGTSITKERLSAINALHNSFMSENVEDLYDAAGRPAGTRVIIYIPLIKTDEHESNHH